MMALAKGGEATERQQRARRTLQRMQSSPVRPRHAEEGHSVHREGRRHVGGGRAPQCLEHGRNGGDPDEVTDITCMMHAGRPWRKSPEWRPRAHGGLPHHAPVATHRQKKQKRMMLEGEKPTTKGTTTCGCSSADSIAVFNDFPHQSVCPHGRLCH